MISKNNHRINFVLPDSLHSAFVSAYPACLSTFLRNALEFAVLDKSFFDMIFFKSFKKENK